jgi:hypothetical protein
MIEFDHDVAHAGFQGNHWVAPVLIYIADEAAPVRWSGEAGD